jgi:hypothetical protein
LFKGASNQLICGLLPQAPKIILHDQEFGILVLQKNIDGRVHECLNEVNVQLRSGVVLRVLVNKILLQLIMGNLVLDAVDALSGIYVSCFYHAMA